MNAMTEEKSLTEVLIDLIAGTDEDRGCNWYLAESVDYADLERRLANIGRRTRAGLFS